MTYCNVMQFLPTERFLDEYQTFQEGSVPSPKQKENALSKTGRVKTFIYFLLTGKKNISDWRFLHDTAGITSYVSSLKSEGKAITTVNYYLRNILQFCHYLKETPPKQCRLSKSQLTGVVRALQAELRSVNKPLVLHQLRVKSNKMSRIIPRSSLSRCTALAKDMIPRLLDQMAARETIHVRHQFYGYLSAFIMSIYGHRPGVLTNMTVGEVQTAKDGQLLDSDQGYVITVSTALVCGGWMEGVSLRALTDLCVTVSG